MSRYKGYPRDAFIPVEPRFWPRVDVRGPDECWPWLAGGKKSGHGMIRVNGKDRMAHQVAWELAHDEPFPVGMDGLHTCDNPPCCNPAHVFPGTQADNVRDMDRKGRRVSSPGERNGRAKLTWEKVGAIRHAHARGESAYSLARRFEMGTTQTHRIIKCQSWTMRRASGKPWTPEAFDGR